jgi:HD-like signal output (HDOD) protein
LWNKSIAVASICKLLAARTKVSADEAFLTGLLHGIGKLYIMARAVHAANGLGSEQSWMELISGWQASIGKAVLQSWGFAEEMCEAVGDQDDVERRRKHEAGLVDVLIAALVLSDSGAASARRNIAIDGINAFLSIGVTQADCGVILDRAEEEIHLIHQALA